MTCHIAVKGLNRASGGIMMGASTVKKEMIAYLYLAIAIVAEVVGTVALKATAEFTKLLPSMIVVVGYGISFYFMALVLRTIPVGITYAIWSGVGIVLVTLFGILIYKQIPDFPAVIGMSLIVSGVVVIQVFSKSVSH